MKTDQQFYDETINHLRRQKVKSIRRSMEDEYGVSTICAYRGDNGTTCAIGCHIPDELYDPSMEGSGINTLIKEYPEVATHLCENTELMSSLQLFHDRMSHNTEVFEEEAERIAHVYHLKYTAPERGS